MIDLETSSTIWLYRKRAQMINSLSDQSRMTSEDAARYRRELEAIESELLDARPAPCLHIKREEKSKLLEYGSIIACIATAESTVTGPADYAFRQLRNSMEHRDDPDKALDFAQTAMFALALLRGRD